MTYETFLPRANTLKLFTEKGPESGYESWFTTELQTAFWDRKIEARKTQKPDMVIEGVEIQVKVNAHRNGLVPALRADIKEHSECKMHLILGGLQNPKQLEDFCTERNLTYLVKPLSNSGWYVALVKQQ